MTYYDSEEVAPTMAFEKVVVTRLAVLVERGLEGQSHSIQQLIENSGHGGIRLSPEPVYSDRPVRWTPLLNTPK
jgi:hypothetical protein